MATKEKLQRVMWRLRQANTAKENIYPSDLQKAIILEIGIDDRTYERYRKALLALGWLKRKKGKSHWYITNEDLTGNF